MPVGFSNRFRSRQVVGLIAIVAMLAQTLGLASVQAMPSPADVVGVICHHDASGREPADAPGTGKAQQDCCVFCTATAAVIVKQPILLQFVPRAVAAALPFSGSAVVLARAIVRAGRSQAPPRIG